MIVFTGPPGSGKTTAMYASLRRIHGPERSLLTIEDPIETQVPWATQVQIDERSGIGFAQVLRAALRQDPNVVLVGEIRDRETAQIASQASMIGMLLLTTLHTVDAPSAVVRLIDLGLEPFLVASSLTAVVAQRLVRKICDRCREPGRPSDVALRALGLKAEELAGVETVVGAGCQACGHTGFRGRTGLFEIMALSPAIRELMVGRASASDLAMLARSEGLPTLRERGIQKAIAGVTTFEEVARVTHADRDRLACAECSRELQPEFTVCPYCGAAAPTHAL